MKKMMIIIVVVLLVMAGVVLGAIFGPDLREEKLAREFGMVKPYEMPELSLTFIVPKVYLNTEEGSMVVSETLLKSESALEVVITHESGKCYKGILEEDGRYYFENLLAGSYQIQVSEEYIAKDTIEVSEVEYCISKHVWLYPRDMSSYEQVEYSCTELAGMKCYFGYGNESCTLLLNEDGVLSFLVDWSENSRVKIVAKREVVYSCKEADKEDIILYEDAQTGFLEFDSDDKSVSWYVKEEG